MTTNSKAESNPAKAESNAAGEGARATQRLRAIPCGGGILTSAQRMADVGHRATPRLRAISIWRVDSHICQRMADVGHWATAPRQRGEKMTKESDERRLRDAEKVV